MASDSSLASGSDAWTKVGKGGRPISFPPEAAAAFGRRSGGGGGGGPYREQRPRRSEFPAEAASAFGRSGGGAPRYERTERVEHAEFDPTASAAFGGGGGRTERRRGAPEFDAAATAAFGGGGRSERPDRDADGFPSAFGKKKSVFAEAASMGFADGDASAGRSYGLSALARKRAEAAKPPPPKPQTYDELFPVLGAPAAAKAAPAVVAAPAPGAKPSFADIMRARAAAEEEETARAELAERERNELQYRDRLERDRLRRLHAARYAHSSTHYAEEEEESDAVEYGGERDLDYDGYGTQKSAFTAIATEEKAVESASDEEETGGDDEAW